MKKGFVGKKRNIKWIVIVVIVLGFGFLFLMSSILALTGTSINGNTAHIKITGMITSESQSFLGTETASSQEIVSNLKKAEENTKIKAILIDINSPGGSAVASEEIATAIKSSEKPVVALIRDLGTSGAYWAASSSDSIIASPLSITGSVGATAAYLEFSELMKKYGVGYERLVSGEFKDAGAPFRKLSEEERELFQEIIELTGNYFAQSVKENRKLSDETVEAISSGRIYTGQQAKELNLIDEFGNIEKAKQTIKEMAEIDEIKLVEYKVKRPFNVASLLSQQSAIIGKNIGTSLLKKENDISLT
ncbi:signal peptide peptidase SppA [Candidatus Woesearchaeota archaeon]|nr:signal peptide peptidase SppA [Candidatus Woesearchaeota archaeon]|tara:strand:- start:9249 stop:10166 length:918 start_codon:yes stop_codon:yes gene_type:complete